MVVKRMCYLLLDWRRLVVVHCAVTRPSRNSNSFLLLFSPFLNCIVPIVLYQSSGVYVCVLLPQTTRLVEMFCPPIVWWNASWIIKPNVWLNYVCFFDSVARCLVDAFCCLKSFDGEITLLVFTCGVSSPLLLLAVSGRNFLTSLLLPTHFRCVLCCWICTFFRFSTRVYFSSDWAIQTISSLSSGRRSYNPVFYLSSGAMFWFSNVRRKFSQSKTSSFDAVLCFYSQSNLPYKRTTENTKYINFLQ